MSAIDIATILTPHLDIKMVFPLCAFPMQFYVADFKEERTFSKLNKTLDTNEKIEDITRFLGLFNTRGTRCRTALRRIEITGMIHASQVWIIEFFRVRDMLSVL